MKVLTWLLIVLYLLLFADFGSAANDSCSSKSGGSCSDCVKDYDCYYCQKTKFCGKRPVIKPSSDECTGDWYSYKQCTVSGNLLLIIVPSVLGGILLITICLCYWCCCRKCCKGRMERKFAREDAKRTAEREAREARHAERTAERKMKHDEIRRKYGLYKDSDDNDGSAKYQRFDVA